MSELTPNQQQVLESIGPSWVFPGRGQAAMFRKFESMGLVESELVFKRRNNRTKTSEFATAYRRKFGDDARFLLQNCGAGYLGNSPVFWKEGGSGYTQWIDEAKRWTLAEAERQVISTAGSHTWKIWPLEQIERLAKRTVDIQDLQKS